jgi:hypothetical protein
MATPPTGSDGQRDYRYSSTGVETVSVTKSAEKVNSETTKIAIKKQTQQLQTKLKSSF